METVLGWKGRVEAVNKRKGDWKVSRIESLMFTGYARRGIYLGRKMKMLELKSPGTSEKDQ